MRNLILASCLILLVGWTAGCQTERRDDPYAAMAGDFEYEEERESRLAFWRWGDDAPPEQAPVTEREILRDMSPELKGRSETPGERRMRAARTIDLNGRSAWDDLMMILLLDRPSRLSLYPTP